MQALVIRTPKPISISIVIAVVDASTRRNLARAFTDEGYEVYPCASATSALHLLGEVRASVLVIDAVMPGENGVQLAKRIRTGAAGEIHRQIPVVLLVPEGRNVVDMSAIEPAGRMTYPFEPEEVIESVADALGTQV